MKRNKSNSFIRVMNIGNGIAMTTFVSLTVYSGITQQYGLMLCSIYGILLNIGSFWWTNVQSK